MRGKRMYLHNRGDYDDGVHWQSPLLRSTKGKTKVVEVVFGNLLNKCTFPLLRLILPTSPKSYKAWCELKNDMFICEFHIMGLLYVHTHLYYSFATAALTLLHFIGLSISLWPTTMRWLKSAPLSLLLFARNNEKSKKIWVCSHLLGELFQLVEFSSISRRVDGCSMCVQCKLPAGVVAATAAFIHHSLSTRSELMVMVVNQPHSQMYTDTHAFSSQLGVMVNAGLCRVLLFPVLSFPFSSQLCGSRRPVNNQRWTLALLSFSSRRASEYSFFIFSRGNQVSYLLIFWTLHKPVKSNSQVSRRFVIYQTKKTWSRVNSAKVKLGFIYGHMIIIISGG